MTHPSSLDLEAFACGEQTTSVAAHLVECTACHGFVERLRGALSAGPSRKRAAEAVTRAAARTVERDEGHESEQPRDAVEQSAMTPAREAARRRWLMKASTVAVPLAAAAALLLILQTPSTKDALIAPSSVSASPPPASEPAPSDPETTFKGGIHIAVIRERAGHQARFTGAVSVRPGDRLRVEVALDREQAILAAVMGDDASWLELMTEGPRRPGTHFSERSARVDASPMRGTILVGTPEAVARARATKRFEDVPTIRVEWEAP